MRKRYSKDRGDPGQGSKAGRNLFIRGRSWRWKNRICQRICPGTGITEPITSPTFTIIQEYEQGRLPFYHFDVYRIADEEEMFELGYESYFFGQGVCLIEWASLIQGLLPAECRTIRIEKDLERGFDYRRVELVDGIALIGEMTE